MAALEFALCAPILFTMMMGMIACTCAFMTKGMMQGAVQYGARVMSTGIVTNNNLGAISSHLTATMTCSGTIPTTQVEYYACSNLPTWSTFTVTTTENCASPGTVTVTLTTPTSTAALTDVYNLFTGQTLTVSAVLMKEGTCP